MDSKKKAEEVSGWYPKSIAAPRELREDEAKKILEVPASKRLMILLPVGKAAASGSQADKKDLSEITFYNKYGQKNE